MKKNFINILLGFVPVSKWRKYVRNFLLKENSQNHFSQSINFEQRINKLKKAGFVFKKISAFKNIYDVLYQGIIFKNVNSNDVLFAIEEMMILNPYGFGGCEEKTVMIDIGMNIADTSLSKARESYITKIYAFEPFRETYKRAIDNIDANPKLASKIIPYNFGLSDTDLKFTVSFDESTPGAQSTYSREFSHSNHREEEVEVKNAAPILREILLNHPNEKVFVKMDCEGDEYRILDVWDKENLLSEVDFIAMEWHPMGGHFVSDLFGIFNKNNFVYFYSQQTSDYPQGTLLAVRQK